MLLPDHLLHVHIEHPQHIEVARSKPWMTRLVDVAGALTARGWNPTADAVIDLEWTRKRWPDAPDEFFCKPVDIAAEVYRIAHQPRSAWSFESVIRPFGETW